MITWFMNGNIVWQVIATVLLSGIKFINTYIPFAIGFIEREEKLKRKVILYALSAMSVAMRFSWIAAAKYGTSIVLLYSIINVLNSLNFRRKNDMFVYLFACGFFTELIWCAFDGILVYDVIIAILKGLSIIAGYMLFGKIEKLNKEMNDKDFLSAITAIGLLLMGLQDISIININIKNIFCIYIVLMLATTNGIKYSTIAGLLLGTMNEIANPSMGVSIISLSLGGFVAGFFKEKNKIFQIWGFLLGNSILAYYIMGYNSLVMKFVEILIASSAFYALSKKTTNDFVIFQTDAIPLLDSSVTMKDLEMSSGSLYSVSELIDDIEVDEENNDDIFDDIKDEICFSCDNYDECWDRNYDETSDEIYSVIEKLEENEKIEITDLFNGGICSNRKEILNKITNKYDNFKSIKKDQPFNVLKQCVSNQFKGFSQYITQMKDKISEDKIEDVETKIINAFEKQNLQLEKVNTNINERECEISLKAVGNMPKVSFLLIANSILSKVLNKRMLISDEKKDFMVFREHSVLKMETEVLTKKADEAAIIGDSYKVVDNLENKHMVILSDGMGTGYEASKVSSALVEMFVEMSKTGINIGTITNMINSFMSYISKTEKIVTLDTMSVDLLTGECEFFKVGSAPSFIIKGKNVEIVSCDTLPLGIFESVEFFQKNYTLDAGDIVVLVSDGIIDSKRNIINKEFWVSSFLRSLDITEPKIIAEELLAKAIENYDGKIKDDITIVVSKVLDQ